MNSYVTPFFKSSKLDEGTDRLSFPSRTLKLLIYDERAFFFLTTCPNVQLSQVEKQHTD